MSINYVALATGALSFTIALAWNDAVSKTVRIIYPPKSDASNAKAAILYAVIITLLVIGAVMLINHTRKLVHSAIGRPVAGTDAPAGGASPPKREPLTSGKEVPFGHGIVTLWSPPALSR